MATEVPAAAAAVEAVVVWLGWLEVAVMARKEEEAELMEGLCQATMTGWSSPAPMR